MTQRTLAASLALAWLVSSGALLAHHSIISFDTSTAVRVKGTVAQFHRINPHSFLVLDPQGGPGQRRWAVGGPSALQLDRRGIAKDAVKPGDVVEVCGYLPKEATVWQLTSPDPKGVSLSGGAHRCFGPEYRDQHSK